MLKANPTFILVSIQKVLELGVEDLQVLLDEDLLTLAGQLVLSGFVEVDLDTPLLLQQTSLRLTTPTINTVTQGGDAPPGSWTTPTFFMYSVTGFCCRNSVLSLV